MPAWGAPLGDEGVSQVTEFVLSLSGRDHDSALAGEGKRKYLQFCIACHAADGKGNAAVGAPNLTDDIWLYGGSSDVIAASIAAGRNGRMPAFETLLGEDKVHLVAAYVYSLRRK
jgi:cytochrome c oxidase cbb3-type subunit 3